MQEEASALGVPCFTLRPNTERPVTISQGTNTLLGEDPAPIADIRPRQLEHRLARIEGWDGLRRAAGGRGSRHSAGNHDRREVFA